MRKPSIRNSLMLELLYIPEQLMRIEAGTGLWSRTRQITMTDNLGNGKHLMKDCQQVRQPFGLSRSTGVARQSVIVQPTLITDADGTGCTARCERLLPAVCCAASSYRRDGYRSDTRSCGTYVHEDKKKHIFRVIEQYC